MTAPVRRSLGAIGPHAQMHAWRASEAGSRARAARMHVARVSGVGRGGAGGRAERGFTLIEVLVALAIMAVGVTAAMALFTAATALHKRALDRTTAALVADAALAEARGAITLAFDPRALGAARAATASSPPVLYLLRDASYPAYKGYLVDVLLTPVDSLDPDEADAFLAEARVRWKASGRVFSDEFKTVILRRATVRDLR